MENIIDRTRFRATVSPKQLTTNNNGPYSRWPPIIPIAYYKVYFTGKDEEFTFCEVTVRSGALTRFDEMIALNKKWVIRKYWKPYHNRELGYYRLSSFSETTDQSITLDLKAHERDDFICGIINYTNHRYIVLGKKDHLDIIVYEGNRTPMLAFLRRAAPGQENNDVRIETQLNDLFANSTPVE